MPWVRAPHWKLGVEAYHRLGEAGILNEDDRVELIEGELIEMAPIGHFHASLGSLIVRRLGYRTEGRAIPWPQNPIHLGPRSEPRPDFALLRYRADGYRDALPTAAVGIPPQQKAKLMKKKGAAAWAVGVLFSLLVSGCSSLRARNEILRDSWTIYPGVQQDVVDIDNIFSGNLQVNAAVVPILFIDVPFSAVFDTLVLPYDLYRTMNF